MSRLEGCDLRSESFLPRKKKPLKPFIEHHMSQQNPLLFCTMNLEIFHLKKRRWSNFNVLEILDPGSNNISLFLCRINLNSLSF